MLVGDGSKVLVGTDVGIDVVLTTVGSTVCVGSGVLVFVGGRGVTGDGVATSLGVVLAAGVTGGVTGVDASGDLSGGAAGWVEGLSDGCTGAISPPDCAGGCVGNGAAVDVGVKLGSSGSVPVVGTSVAVAEGGFAAPTLVGVSVGDADAATFATVIGVGVACPGSDRSTGTCTPEAGAGA